MIKQTVFNMGYSIATKAANALDILSRHCINTTGKSNTWVHKGITYFWERGKEQPDGTGTGSVWKLTPDGKYANKTGFYRIDPDGKIIKFTAWPFKWKDYHVRFKELKELLFAGSMFVVIDEKKHQKELAEYDLIIPAIMVEKQLGIDN